MTRTSWLGSATAGAAAALTTSATAYLLTHDPNEPGHYPTCALLEVTGFWYPACGGTRAAHTLLHGDVAGAAARNPLILVLVLVALTLVGRFMIQRRRPLHARRALPTWVPVAVGVGILVFGVLRNVPGWTWLSPA